jgi:endonuclease YncB( thermonuclease family)
MRIFLALLAFLCLGSACGKKQKGSYVLGAANAPVTPIHCVKDNNHNVKEGGKAFVKRVSDGDTVFACFLDGSGKGAAIRIPGIDCPESSANPKCLREQAKGVRNCKQEIKLGLKAKAEAREHLLNQVVLLEASHKKGFARDRYGRLLAYLRTTDGEDFGKRMLTAGLCRDYSAKYDHLRSGEYSRIKSALGAKALSRIYHWGLPTHCFLGLAHCRYTPAKTTQKSL